VAEEDRKQEIAQRFPEAVAFARLMREVFGDGVRILYAKNGSDTLGILEWMKSEN
jgi:hypothetical protein